MQPSVKMEFKRGSVLGPRRRTFALKHHKQHSVKNSVVDIDKKDAKNPLAVAEYVKDLYESYKQAESSSLIPDYMFLQTQMNENIRMGLVQWLVGFHDFLEFTPEVIFLAIHIIDRYLATNQVPRTEFLLVALTALLIAGKYEEDKAARPVEVYVAMADGFYSRKQILAMERLILKKLGWNLSTPTTYHFLVRFIKAAEADMEMERLVVCLAISGLMQYAVMNSCTPSMLAASAVHAANCILQKTQLWNATLQHYTGFCEFQVLECSKQLVSFHYGAA